MHRSPQHSGVCYAKLQGVLGRRSCREYVPQRCPSASRRYAARPRYDLGQQHVRARAATCREARSLRVVAPCTRDPFRPVGGGGKP